MMDIWDERDFELGLRDKMATLIAEIVSGIKNATPTLDDYALADALRGLVENDTLKCEDDDYYN